jgi:hypothetical protein
VIEDWLGYRFRDWLDAEGRPLGEIGSTHYPAVTPTAPCPYAGVRKGNPMNLGALKQVRAHWETNLATLTSLRGDTVADALRAVTIAVSAPLAFAVRPVPVVLAAVHKANLGYQQTLVSLLLDSPGLAAQPARELPDGSTLLAALEEGHWLQGTVQACAGAPADIALAWEVITGRADRPGEPLKIPETGIYAWLGLEIALVLRTAELLHAGVRPEAYGTADPPVDRWPLGARLWKGQRGPWLIGATARAGRSAESARQLYADAPRALDTFLAKSCATHEALEAAFRAALSSSSR